MSGIFSLHSQGTCIAAEHWERAGEKGDLGGRRILHLDFAFGFCLGDGKAVVDGLVIADRFFKMIPHIVTFYTHTRRTVEFTFDDLICGCCFMVSHLTYGRLTFTHTLELYKQNCRI